MEPEFDSNDLVREAQVRWLKPAEVHFIIQNCEDHHLLSESVKKPPSGSLLLYNKRVLRNFRKDGHNWRKKRDGRTVGEGHERLKVGNVETLNCYYAHGEDNPDFQRRSFWMLSGDRSHIVLVQYRDVANQSPGSGSHPSFLFSSSSSLSPNSSIATNQESFSISGGYESHINLCSPVSTEICSGVGMNKNLVEYYNSLGETSETMTASDTDVNQALRRLEEQLSLNDDNLNEISSFNSKVRELNSSDFESYGTEIANHGRLGGFSNGSNYIAHDSGYPGVQDDFTLLQEAGGSGMRQQHTYTYEAPGRDKDDVSWTEMVDFGEGEHLSNGLQDMFPQNADNFEGPPFSSFVSSQQSKLSYQGKSFDTDQTLIQPQAYSNLTIAQNQKYTILDMSPDWGYSFETTKVIIVGSFLCHPSENAWSCMFGDIEVPIQIIQEGVILCEAPPNPSGKVTLCITSANRESCSEVREFEYRDKTSSCIECSGVKETFMIPEELLLLVRLSQMLLCDSLEQRGDCKELGNSLSRNGKFDEDSWSLIVESLLVGSGTYAGTTKWLLQEFIKDKLVKWLSSKSQEQSAESSCLLSKKEQGIIHMIAGLGYEWALAPILSSGVSINFRDINGWTALHWAARFGREKMVASLIASGALAGAVTDPNEQDPSGKTPASIAAINGHKGLAGYLSEVALTSHLSSLTLQESELSKGLAVLEAEHTVNCISDGNINSTEDQLSMKDTLSAIRNAASAAARIQSAFRAHSFRKRQQKKASNLIGVDEYGFSSDDVQGLSVVSKLAFRNTRDHNSAALSIQKKYRGYKHRKDFLDVRQKVVKIQAHVRGYQTRKHYKVCWAVGILEKVVLRWRRKGVGLRGYKPEPETIDESDEEDFAKVFRKKKVEAAVEEAVSRVLSMVESPEAQNQYRRMLERYRQAKAQLGNAANEEASASQTDVSNMDDDQNQTLPDSFY